ncbi:MAG: LacI family DNA-binding transcriptional regulator [Bacteroidota bacterium]
MKHTTIKDVARKLGVSVSTVSRAFNDKYDIKKETKDRILSVAKKMGYSPNPIAQKLTRQRSYTIGMVVPEFVNSFFPEVIIGAQAVLLKKGYQVLIMQSDLSWETERKNVKTLVDNKVDGLIISLTSETENTGYYEELIASNMPIVFFNRVVDQLETSKVLFDDFKWSFFATEHLIVQGFTEITHFAGNESFSLTKNRIQGFKAAHRKHQVQIGEIMYKGFTFEDGESLAESLLKRDELPQAVFAANDALAIGAMHVFKKNGLRIPEDVAVVGFSESRLAAHISPTLTSVQQPTHDIGETASNLLLEQIENKGLFVPQTIVLNGRLNVRESSVFLR